jgi:hypothetical protein
MLHSSDIPLLNSLHSNLKFPDTVFQTKRKSKRFQVIYSLLSKQYAENILLHKNLLINADTFFKIKEYLNEHPRRGTHHNDKNKSNLTTLTIQNGKVYYTYILILSFFNGNINFNILSFKETALFSWLGGIFQNTDDIYISVQYNLTENEAIQLFDLFNFITELITLKKFEQIYCNHSGSSSLTGQSNIIKSDLLQIDLSVIREYIMPATQRREHYRWQFCGPGRTILKRIKVKETMVKEYTRRGKRIE